MTDRVLRTRTDVDYVDENPPLLEALLDAGFDIEDAEICPSDEDDITSFFVDAPNFEDEEEEAPRYMNQTRMQQLTNNFTLIPDIEEVIFGTSSPRKPTPICIKK